jgi:hypothetical protein
MTVPYTLAIGGTFTESFYSGVAANTSTVPGKFDVALAGRGYVLDLEGGYYIDKFTHKTVTMTKGQTVDSAEPGEQTLNPEAAWRRSTSSWHLGAGQIHRDLKDSDGHRFRSSKGVNPWTRSQLTLLADTAVAHTVANTGTTAKIVSTGTKLYYTDLQTVYQTDLTTKTACTGTPAAAVTALASTGGTIYAAFGASGVYKATGTAFTSFEASTTSLVGFVKGRLLSASGSALRDISTGTAVVVTPANLDTAFSWVAFAEGTSHAYAAGNIGDKGIVYRLAVKSDGTGLDVPVIAARLPDGETVAAIYGYSGVIVIGTSRGFRVATQAGSGDLTYGPVVDLGVTVGAFCGRGQYVWFGWSNYDAASTGVGRMDLQNFTEPYVPAYASDLMVTGSGVVDGVQFLGSTLAVGVTAVGIYQPTANLVASGTLDSGVINFNIGENKTVIGGRPDWSDPGTVTMAVATQGGAFTQINITGETRKGTYHEHRLTLNRSGLDATTGPTVRAATLYAYPAPVRTELITVPLVLTEQITAGIAGSQEPMDVNAVIAEIRSLAADQTITTFQIGALSYTVKVDDFAWRPVTPCKTQKAWNGTMICQLKVVF